MDTHILHLGTCNTCKRIIGEIKDMGIKPTLQDVREQPVTEKQLDTLYQAAGSYEALFNRRSRQYRARGLQVQSLTEEDYRKLLLEEATFLKRPVIQVGDSYYIGNGKKTISAAKQQLKSLL